jgi:hypothetical protein
MTATRVLEFCLIESPSSYFLSLRSSTSKTFGRSRSSMASEEDVRPEAGSA